MDRKLLILLDMKGVQVAPITQKTDFNELLASDAAAGLVPIPGYLVYALRPGATELVLNLLTRGADVAIWSSTPAWIVNPLVEAILPSASDRARLVGVFTQCFHRCDMEGRPLKIVADVASDARLIRTARAGRWTPRCSSTTVPARRTSTILGMFASRAATSRRIPHRAPPGGPTTCGRIQWSHSSADRTEAKASRCCRNI